MNKLFLYTLIIFSFISLTSCDDNDPNEDKFENNPESGWVYFSRVTTSIPYSSVSSIPVTLEAPVNSEGLDITYMVEAVDNSTTPNEVLGTFTQENAIAPGQLEGFININLAEITEGVCYQIGITIIDTNNSSVQIGLDQNEEEGTTVYPTEHYISVSEFPESFEGTTFFQGSAVYSFTPTLTPVEGEENVYLIDTAWGVGFLPSLNPSLDDLPYAGILTINVDGSVTIEGNLSYATGGTGIYNACDQTISYTLTQEYLSDTTVTFDVILSPEFN